MLLINYYILLFLFNFLFILPIASRISYSELLLYKIFTLFNSILLLHLKQVVVLYDKSTTFEFLHLGQTITPNLIFKFTKEP